MMPFCTLAVAATLASATPLPATSRSMALIAALSRSRSKKAASGLPVLGHVEGEAAAERLDKAGPGLQGLGHDEDENPHHVFVFEFRERGEGCR